MGDDVDGRIGAVLDRIRELGIDDSTYVAMPSGLKRLVAVGSSEI